MNTFVVALVAALAVAQGSIIAPSAKILQGPSSRTTLVGPEGSVISSYAPGGQVVTDDHPGFVAHAAPIAHAAYAAPVVTAPVLAAHGYAAPVVAAHGYAAHGYAAPVVAAHGYAAHGYAAPVIAAHGLPLAAHIDAHGYDGQYVHDHSEALYDDGSYKPHVHY